MKQRLKNIAVLLLGAILLSGCMAAVALLGGGEDCCNVATENGDRSAASTQETNETMPFDAYSEKSVVFEHNETITTNAPNATYERFDIVTPAANSIVFNFSAAIHAHDTSGNGAGEITAYLLDSENNIVFQKTYAGDGEDSVELDSEGGTYTLVVEGGGGGSMYIVGYKTSVTVEKTSASQADT